jgi:uncharacterized protein (DUF2384 family)
MNCAVPVLRLRRARLLHVATRALGDEAAAKAWVRSPQPALGGEVPEALADSLEGLERALAELESMTPES